MSALVIIALFWVPPADTLLGADPAGNPIYTSSGAVFVVDLEEQRVLHRVRAGSAAHRALRLSDASGSIPDGRGGTLRRVGSQVVRHTAETDTPIIRAAHRGAVTHLLAVRDTDLAVSAGVDGQVIVWHAPTGTPLSVLPLHAGAVTHLIEADCPIPTVVSIGADAQIMAIALTGTIVPQRLGAAVGAARSGVTDADCHLGVVGDAAIQVFDLSTFRRVDDRTPATPVQIAQAVNGMLVFSLAESPGASGPTRVLELPREIVWTARAVTVRPRRFAVPVQSTLMRRLPGPQLRAVGARVRAASPDTIEVNNEAPIRVPGSHLSALVRPGRWLAAGTADGQMIFRRSLLSRSPRPLWLKASPEADGRVRIHDPRVPIALRLSDGGIEPPAAGRMAPDGRHFIDRERVVRVADRAATDLRDHRRARWLDSKTLVTRTWREVVLLDLQGRPGQRWAVPDGPTHIAVHPDRRQVVGIEHGRKTDAIWVLDVFSGERVRHPLPALRPDPKPRYGTSSLRRRENKVRHISLSPSGRTALIKRGDWTFVTDLVSGAVHLQSERKGWWARGLIDDETLLVRRGHDLYRLSLTAAQTGKVETLGTHLISAVQSATRVPGTGDVLVTQADCIVLLDPQGHVRWHRQPDGRQCSPRIGL